MTEARIGSRGMCCAAALSMAAGAAGAQHHHTHDRPNVIVITTDDQDAASMSVRRPDGEFVMSAVRRRLGDEGMTFANCFVPTSICAPSRATLLTGQYAHNHGVLTNGEPHGGYDHLDHDNTLPVWLRAAGYRTAHIGSYVNGYGSDQAPTLDTMEIPPGWSDWFTTFTPPYHFFNHRMNENGQIVQYSNEEQDYHTDVVAQKAVHFIHGQSASQRPFYLAIDFMAPHTPTIPAPRHVGAMASYVPDVSPSFNEEDLTDKPRFLRNRHKVGAASVLFQARRRMECLLGVDEAVDAIVQAVEDAGVADNTFILFLSDNGFHLGEHRLFAEKGYLYEESIRVPLIVRGPGIPAGTRCDAIASTVDIVPTIVGWSGAVAGRVMDGRSLSALLGGHSMSWRTALLLESPFHRGHAAIRTRGFVYGEYDYDDDGVVEDRELYPLLPHTCSPAPDPFQLQSRATSPCLASARDLLAQRLAALRDCRGWECWEEMPMQEH